MEKKKKKMKPAQIHLTHENTHLRLDRKILMKAGLLIFTQRCTFNNNQQISCKKKYEYIYLWIVLVLLIDICMLFYSIINPISANTHTPNAFGFVQTHRFIIII